MAEGVLSRWVIPIGADTREFKKEIANLVREARALGSLSRHMNKMAAVLTKAIIAPLITLGTLGVKKFLETTDDGAGALKKQLQGLNNSWNQMLARIGAAIYRHTELAKIIEKIKKFMDGINEKTILRMLEIGKWAAILAVVLRISGAITGWLRDILSIRTDLLKLAVPVVPVGAAAGAAAAGAAGAGAGGVAAAAALARAARAAAAGRTVEAAEALEAAERARAGTSAVARAGTATSAAARGVAIPYTGTPTPLPTTSTMSAIGKTAGMLALVFAAIGVAISAIMGLFQGLSGKKEGLLSGLEAITWMFTKIFQFFETFFKVVHGVLFRLGTTIRFLMGPNRLSKTGYDEMIEQQKKSRNRTLEAVGALWGLDPVGEKRKASKLLEYEWKKYFPKRELGLEVGDDEKFDFGHKYMGVSPALELNRVFQEMALENQKITMMKTQTGYLKEIADNTSSKQGTILQADASSVFSTNYALA